MKPLERLRRLSALRAKQHDVAVVELRSAQMSFDAADRSCIETRMIGSTARDAHRTALELPMPQERLMANVDADWQQRAAVICHANRDAASRVVAVAAERELEARRTSMQMDMVLQRVRDEELQRQVLVEQKELDEIGRLLRARSITLAETHDQPLRGY